MSGVGRVPCGRCADTAAESPAAHSAMPIRVRPSQEVTQDDICSRVMQNVPSSVSNSVDRGDPTDVHRHFRFDFARLAGFYTCSTSADRMFLSPRSHFTTLAVATCIRADENAAAHFSDTSPRNVHNCADLTAPAARSCPWTPPWLA